MKALPPAPTNLPALRDERGRFLSREMRDPRAATQRIGYVSYEMPVINEWDADQAFRYGYLANVIAYRCIQLRANAVASIPIVAGRRLGDASTINETAPITKLLGPPPGGPCPRLSARKLIRWTMAQEIVTGRRAWEIETDDNDVPIAFWPLVAAQLRPKASKGGIEWFSGFEYGSYHDPVKFKPEDVFYSWDPAGTDFRQAESVLQSARYDLSLVTMCDRYGVSFLRNNAVPATVVTTTAFESDDQRRAFRWQWQGEYGDVDNAGRTLFNEAGDDGDGPVAESIDVKVLGLSAKDARLVEQRKGAMMEIAIALGTPWSKLDASGRTFDNAEIEDRTWYEETILPDLIDLQDDINMQLAPRLGGDVVWFDLREVRAFQRKFEPVTQKVGVPALLTARVMKIDEGRADYRLDPLPDGEGDRFLTDDEIILMLSPASAAAPDVPTPPVLPAGTPALPPVAGDGANDVATDGTARGDDGHENRALDPEQVELRRARIWRTSDAVARGLEARWVRAWRKLFAKQADATVARLKGKRGRQAQTRAQGDPIDSAAVFDPQFWETETADVVDGLYEETVQQGLLRLTAAYGIDFDLAAPYVRDFIDARTNQLAGPVMQTTYEAIQAALAEGVAAGEGIDDIADRVRAVFTQASQTRAETIARTEVMSAYNGAASLGATQLPADVVAGQEWIATRDSRTREQHAEADGQIVAIGSPFAVGGHELAYPGDPAGGAKNTVNCRCTVAFLTPDEFAEGQGRARLRVESRVAGALLRAVRVNDAEFDLLSFRRALQEVAA